MRQTGDDIRAQVFRIVEFRAISKRAGPGPPATAVLAAGQRAYRMDKLMVRISLPMGRFSSARNHNAGTVGRTVGFALNRGSEVHQTSHSAEHSLRMVHEAN
jgi:hypothetical protein